jgi:hypothetical protein
VLDAGVVDNAKTTFDPVFVSAIGMARASHGYMDDIHFKIDAAPGCVWRSKLYVEPDREL